METTEHIKTYVVGMGHVIFDAGGGAGWPGTGSCGIGVAVHGGGGCEKEAGEADPGAGAGQRWHGNRSQGEKGGTGEAPRVSWCCLGVTGATVTATHFHPEPYARFPPTGLLGPHPRRAVSRRPSQRRGRDRRLKIPGPTRRGGTVTQNVEQPPSRESFTANGDSRDWGRRNGSASTSRLTRHRPSRARGIQRHHHDRLSHSSARGTV